MDTMKEKRFGKTLIAAALTTIIAGAQLPLMSSAIAKPQASEPMTLQQERKSFANLIKQVKPAVVSITTTGKGKVSSGMPQPQFSMPDLPEGSPFREFFQHFSEKTPKTPQDDHHQQVKGAGSGFIISADGYIVTNHHVIDEANEIEVMMDDGTPYTATVKGSDSKTDLALIKIDVDKPLPFVEMGDSSKAEVGDWVVAVGNQFGLGGTATAGIISARGRDIQSGPFDDFLQIDAPINRGNSGGPLFDTNGQVVGINTAIYSPSGGNVGIGFAIPSNMAKDIVAQLLDNGGVSRGWLGVHIQPVTDEIAESLDLNEAKGVLVASVVKGSPAGNAGIKPGDVITSMDGVELDEFKDLSKRVAGTKAGSSSVFHIQREGTGRDVKVNIGSMPGEKEQLAGLENESVSDTAALGIQLTGLTPEARKQYSIDKDSYGVLVTDVKANSPASRAGIRTGYVINMVGQKVVKTPDEVVERVKAAADKKHTAVLLRVEFQGEKRFVSVKLASA